MSYFEKVKDFVDEKFKEAGRKDHLVHLRRTVDWVEELRPDADEALLIAAYAHDIQHAERWSNSVEQREKERPERRDFRDKERMKKHEARGAEIIGDFLREKGAPEEMVERVENLIDNHEEGGTEDQNILKDADSVSFLETKIDAFLEKAGVKLRKKDVRDKFDYMFERLSTQRAREISEPWYREAVYKLEEKSE